jgi:hypothetical protein
MIFIAIHLMNNIHRATKRDFIASKICSTIMIFVKYLMP